MPAQLNLSTVSLVMLSTFFFVLVHVVSETIVCHSYEGNVLIVLESYYFDA